MERDKEKVLDSYAEGLAATFALVACADADIDPMEPLTLSRFLRESPDFSELQQSQIEVHFNKFVRGLMEDYAAEKETALLAVAHMCARGDGQAIAIKVARAAVVADGRVRIQEELILKDIADAIGVSSELL